MPVTSHDWICKKWMGGVTCHRKRTKGTKSYTEVRRFDNEAEYAASDLYPTRRHKRSFAIKTIRQQTQKRVGRHLRIAVCTNCPKGKLSTLRCVPRDWRDRPDSFETERVWHDGSLPSFKQMGAIGSLMGVVIYPRLN